MHRLQSYRRQAWKLLLTLETSTSDDGKARIRPVSLNPTDSSTARSADCLRWRTADLRWGKIGFMLVPHVGYGLMVRTFSIIASRMRHVWRVADWWHSSVYRLMHWSVATLWALSRLAAFDFTSQLCVSISVRQASNSPLKTKWETRKWLSRTMKCVSNNWNKVILLRKYCQQELNAWNDCSIWGIGK